VAPPSVDRGAAAAAAVSEVQRRWGLHSLARPAQLGLPSAGAARRPDDAPAGRHLPWWPGRTAGPRPRLVELVAPVSSGGLSLALLWVAASTGDGLVAVVDPPAEPGHARLGRFYPPAAAVCGLDPGALVVVFPPRLTDVLLAATVLARSEGFAAVLFRLPETAARRLPTAAVGRLALLAARAGTTLLGLVQEEDPPVRQGHASAVGRDPLAAFGDYRLRVVETEWLWADHELVGVRVRVRTEKARHAVDADEHDLILRLHRRGRDGHAEDRLRLDTVVLPGRRPAADAGAGWPAAGAPPGRVAGA
jgi:hypothetical protein